MNFFNIHICYGFYHNDVLINNKNNNIVSAVCCIIVVWCRNCTVCFKTKCICWCLYFQICLFADCSSSRKIYCLLENIHSFSRCQTSGIFIYFFLCKKKHTIYNEEGFFLRKSFFFLTRTILSDYSKYSYLFLLYNILVM